jgi:hypothetical protein
MCVSFVVDKVTGLPPPRPSSQQQQDGSSQASSASSLAAVENESLAYMFALRIHDDTAVTDAVVFGKVKTVYLHENALLTCFCGGYVLWWQCYGAPCWPTGCVLLRMGSSCSTE